MKKITTAMSVLIVMLLVVLYRVDLRRRQLSAQMINQHFVVLLDDVAFSYAPLKFIDSSEQEKAQELLLGRLGDALVEYDEFIRQHPQIRGENNKMIENARELHDRKRKTEPVRRRKRSRVISSP
jgi:hypothetical protein